MCFQKKLNEQIKFLTSTPGLVRTNRPIPENRGFHNTRCPVHRLLPLKIEDYTQGSIIKSWEVNIEKAMNEQHLINKEEKEPPAYQFMGSITSTGGRFGENCYTWCRKHLINLGVPVRDSTLTALIGAVPTIEARKIETRGTKVCSYASIFRKKLTPTTATLLENTLLKQTLLSELVRAASIGDYNQAETALKNGADVNGYVDGYITNAFHPHYGRTPLMIAALHGHFSLVKLFIEQFNADIFLRASCKRDEKRSAAKFAESNNFEEITHYLDKMANNLIERDFLLINESAENELDEEIVNQKNSVPNNF